MVSTLVLVSAILVSWFPYYNYRLSESELDKRLEKAVDFLLIQYTPQLRLCCESTYVAPNTYWLASDNLLAYHALEPYYPNISMMIYLELEERDGLKSELYEALFGESVPLPIKEKVTYVVEQHDDYVIKTDIHNCTSAFPYWDEYANLLICSALSLHWEGNHTEALRLFDKVIGMWDGKGLHDRAIEEAEENLLGLYETYKLALLLYASRILQRPLPFRSQLESVLWTTQRVSDGGMVTHYNGSTTPITPIGDANVETASFTIIAYRYTPDTNSYSLPSLGTQCCVCREGAESLRRFYRLFVQEPLNL
ncbi:MAG: hypothetical protein ACUVWK_06425 [Nitrososphaerales archaeon]